MIENSHKKRVLAATVAAGVALSAAVTGLGLSGRSGATPAPAGSGTGCVGNQVWYEVDGNGVHDAGELPAVEVTANLVSLSNNQIVATATTDASGNYQLCAAPGAYQVSLPRTGLNGAQTSGAAVYVSQNLDNRNHGFSTLNAVISSGFMISTGSSNTTVDFALKAPTTPGTAPTTTSPAPVVPSTVTTTTTAPSSCGDAPCPTVPAGPCAAGQGGVSDLVWNDTNGDGIHQATEAGINGVTVNLVNLSTGALVGSAITSNGGKYLICAPAGSYQIVIPAQAATAGFGLSPNPAYPWENINDRTHGFPSGTNVISGGITLPAGVIDSTLDFGFTTPAPTTTSTTPAPTTTAAPTTTSTTLAPTTTTTSTTTTLAPTTTTSTTTTSTTTTVPLVTVRIKNSTPVPLGAQNETDYPLPGTCDKPGDPITLVVSDTQGKSVTVSTTCLANGTFSTTANLMSLNPGVITITAVIKDKTNPAITATDVVSISKASKVCTNYIDGSKLVAGINAVVLNSIWTGTQVVQIRTDLAGRAALGVTGYRVTSIVDKSDFDADMHLVSPNSRRLDEGTYGTIDGWGDTIMQLTYVNLSVLNFPNYFANGVVFHTSLLWSKAGSPDITMNNVCIQLTKIGVVRADPIAIDLNNDGVIGVTGSSTARNSAPATAAAKSGRTVKFDMDSNGNPEAIGWVNGSGDGLLVDNRDGKAATHMDGKHLFGQDSNAYDNGYAKLATLDTNHDGIVSGDELKGVMIWVDNGNAKVDAGELRTLSSVGITSLSTKTTDSKGLTRSTATTATGKTLMTEDVWFSGLNQ